MVSPSMLKPIIDDQYTAARAYFLCVIAMLFLESTLRLPSYLRLLYRKGRPATRSGKHWTIYTRLHKLTTLPSSVPFITNHNLPILLRAAIFTFLNFLWGWNQLLYTTNYQLYGWLTIANGGLGLLLGARTNLFAQVARIPSPVLLMYHRWVGLATFVHATLHVSLIVQHYIQTDQLATAVQAPRVPVGFAAWVSLVLIAITSVPVIRRRWFEAFYYTHFLFIVFVAGALYHATKGPEFLLPGFGLWVIDRGIRFYNNFRGFSITSVVHYPGGVAKFKIAGLEPSHPGQMAWVQIPSISCFNWHPFTIASAPGQDTATIAIRALGSYTKQVCMSGEDDIEMAQMRNNSDASEAECAQRTYPKMRIDGPYGVGRLQWGQHPVVVLVAGGIGIAPGMGIATYLVNQAAAGIASDRTGWHVHLLWTVRDISHLAWFEDELKSLAAVASDPTVPVTLEVTIHVTNDSASGSTEEEAEPLYKYNGPGEVHQGRVDMVKWFEDVRDLRRGLDASVNLCGPRKLVDAGGIAASKASCDDVLFHVEEETFEF